MAEGLNQMIALHGRGLNLDPAGQVGRGQQLMAGFQDLQMQPLRKKEAELRLAALEQENQASTDEFKIRDLATDAIKIKPLLESGDLTRANTMIAERIQKIMQRGGDPADTVAFRDALNSKQITPQQAAAELGLEIEAAKQAGVLGRGMHTPAGQQQFNSLLDMLRPAMDANGQIDPSKLTAEQRAAANELGLTAKVGTMTGAERIATTPGMTAPVAQSQATIKAAEAGAAEGAKLNQQAEKLPSVQGAVTAAKEAAKSGSKETGKAKSNATALRVYETGITNLKTALGDTTTGPMIGWMPAFTSNQQKAEGAVAAMAPILKEIFRSAGEGTFTEGDQRLLMDMIPGRGTLPEAADAQLQAIDQIVRAKLGGGAQPQQPAQQGQPTGGVKFLGFE